ncbi:uncharacterized protein LOC112692425 [Sipha flava]|uniref:Uncharacterized protein LOC112692425 n=1 Tax=Sipha flava TaxID=143950 RepID=A0A8B8GKA3_9HEMI|nr:uncharacterized protein LOC112692425 [Sipha flava]
MDDVGDIRKQKKIINTEENNDYKKIKYSVPGSMTDTRREPVLRCDIFISLELIAADSSGHIYSNFGRYHPVYIQRDYQVPHYVTDLNLQMSSQKLVDILQ